LDGEWLTYAQAGERLGVSPVAARFRAIRGRWQRVVGNDGRTRIYLPNDEHTASTRGERSPSARASEGRLIKSLEAHIDTLKEQLSVAEARLIAERETTEAERARFEKLAADFAAREAKIAADLAAERERADKQAADFGSDLAHERARADKAIAAFASLADKLDALAAERSRPWWKRIRIAG
jgi:hypothetical protein